VLSMPDALATLREHREVLVTDSGVNSLQNRVVSGPYVIR
jgi:hypothetical protein